MTHFGDRLCDAIQEKNSRVCVGLDPRLDRLPEALRKGGKDAAGAFEKFCCRVIDAVREHAVAVKPQIAFFERLGPDGLGAYLKICRYAQDKKLIVIGDCKRGDIGSTSQAYAEGHFLAFNCDAITVNPYFGTDGMKPFLDVARREGRGLFVLVKTSNPSSSEIQDLEVDGKPLYEIIGGIVDRWGSELVGERGYSSVGAVVGATHPKQASVLRGIMPKAFFLVPGYGAQGAGAADVASCFNRDAGGAIVNAARSVIYAFDAGAREWEPAVAAAAEKMKKEINEALGATG
ncbi:MAG: orotidine-5'-phosphate decarboxylase [Planctomycetota bacterium]